MARRLLNTSTDALAEKSQTDPNGGGVDEQTFRYQGLVQAPRIRSLDAF